MKLNNKGFTLIEVLAVVVILSLLMAIMIPSVNTLINKNKEANYEDLKSSIKKAAKIFLSDNRYEVVVNTGECSESNNLANVTSINGTTLTDSKLPINVLVDAGDLKTNAEGDILNPRNTSKKLIQKEEDLTASEKELGKEISYIVVKYQCDKKDYTYELKDEYLSWK